MLARISTLLQYGPQADDVTGSLIRFTAEAFQLELGIVGQIFKVPAVLAPAIMDSWIKACWLDMAQSKIHIYLDIPEIEMPWMRDVELMRAFIRAGYRTEELATINRCHMHIWVIFLLDICTGAGEQVDQRWLWGEVSHTYDQYSRPQMGNPSASKWAVWHRAIHVAFNLDSQKQLPYKLGAWKTSMTTLNRWYFTSKDQ